MCKISHYSDLLKCNQILHYAKVIKNKNNLKKSKELKSRLIEVNKTLKSISPQSEFSNWAKARRHQDKLKKELDDINNLISNTQFPLVSFMINVSFFVLPSLSQYALTYLNNQSSIIHLPPTLWYSYPIAYVLSLPFSPITSISSTLFSMILKRNLNLFLQLFSDFKLILN